MTLELHKPTPELVREIAAVLRPIDRLELNLLTDLQPPEEALWDSVLVSGEDAWIVTDDGVPLCIFGVAPGHQRGLGIPWMMASPLMHEHRSDLLREARKVVEGFHMKYPVLGNVVYQYNHSSIVFLKRLGFNFVSRLNLGYLNAPFLSFLKNV